MSAQLRPCWVVFFFPPLPPPYPHSHHWNPSLPSRYSQLLCALGPWQGRQCPEATGALWVQCCLCCISKSVRVLWLQQGRASGGSELKKCYLSHQALSGEGAPLESVSGKWDLKAHFSMNLFYLPTKGYPNVSKLYFAIWWCLYCIMCKVLLIIGWSKWLKMICQSKSILLKLKRHSI